jgi:hypothetical protein
MKRFMVFGLALGLAIAGTAQRANAQASKIATSMGDLRWGLSESETTAYAKRYLEQRYDAQIQKTKDNGKKGQLRADLKKAQADVGKSLISFEGKSSRWDVSPVAGEFTYGNGESMLVAKEPEATNYYFFLNGRLWKWYKAVDQGAAGGDFKKFSRTVEGQFGKGRVKKGELAPGKGETQWLEYLDRNSRMRAADNSKRGVFAMIFEEMATVRELASTRAPTKSSRLAGAEEDEAAAETKAAAAKQTKQNPKADDNQVAKANTKRSIFNNDRQEETEADFQARKQKTAADARERQVRLHEKKEDAKKGEVLKQLDGLNDSDPLGGL